MMNGKQRRAGAILPMVVIGLIGMLGCVALAIDIGMIATARTQCQNVADVAAMAGARTMNGDVGSSNNLSSVEPNARLAATENGVFGVSVVDTQVQIQTGSYTYDEAANKFVVRIPRDPNDNYNLVRANVSFTNSTAFARIFNINAFSISTTAVAAHRPRDVAIILDHSGSMRFDSLLGIPHTGNRSMSNNPDPDFPVFGHYANTSAAALQNTNPFTTMSGTVYGSANISVETPAGKPIIEDFYQHSAGTSKVAAFTRALSTYTSTPAGDNYLFRKGSTTNYAQHVQHILGASTSAQGEKAWTGYTNPPYAGYAGPTVPEFSGYTAGPSYWGKTFWIWPPDPRSSNDWRQKFFGTTDNTDLYTSSGAWRTPGSYTINYDAILSWIKDSGANPFPPRLRAGRILYYDAIPSSIVGNNPSDPNQAFWKQYIEYVLGLRYNTGSNSYTLVTAQTGYGDDFQWGTTAITAPASGDTSGQFSSNYSAGVSTINTKNWAARRAGDRVRLTHTDGTQLWYTVVSASSSGSTRTITLDRGLDTGVAQNAEIIASTSVMPYYDNPLRPRLHFWFGPMTMIDFLGNYNTGQMVWPGTCHEAPLYSQKLGIRAALNDIQRNHPNDSVTMMMFSNPKNSSSGAGQFNRTRAPLGRKYRRLQDGLFYPPDTIIDDDGTPGADISPWAAANEECPRSKGNTCPVMGFMLAYNQFSIETMLKTHSPNPAPAGEAGGLGRKGSQKLIIFETDGVANTPADAQFINNGPYMSHYKVHIPGNYPSNSGNHTDQTYSVVDQIVALDSATKPGYGTARKPVLIHCLAFGTLFEPTTTSSQKGTALTFLQNIQYKGKTQASASTALPDEKKIIGTSDERVAKLRSIFLKIMQDGVQVSLLE